MDSVRQSGTALSWGRLANAHSDGWLPGNRFRTTTRGARAEYESFRPSGFTRPSASLQTMSRVYHE